ncbi:MAG: hypothetical protein IJ468_02450 [Lachnospiraceae bacterium]|nr:hypothetical protein [Lachnospiraceae bacterium]
MAQDTKQTKRKKIKAIPSRQIDFYSRLQRTPEKMEARRKKRLAVLAAVAVMAVLAAVQVILYMQVTSLERETEKLRIYLAQEELQERSSYADQLILDAGATKRKLEDVSNAAENINSYPIVTTEMIELLEQSCPDLVQITITGYQSLNGQLLFDAVAPKETDISDAIVIWRDELDIFEDVYYTGFTENYDSVTETETYQVKVTCILKEETGK